MNEMRAYRLVHPRADAAWAAAASLPRLSNQVARSMRLHDSAAAVHEDPKGYDLEH